MDIKGETAGIYIRVIALISIALGLADAARLLGVGTGAASPLAALGTGGFVFLTLFSLARIFAGVGLWIRASWGAVLLVGATTVELAMFLLGSPDVKMNMIGFGVRLILLSAILVVFLLGLRLRHAGAE